MASSNDQKIKDIEDEVRIGLFLPVTPTEDFLSLVTCFIR
jgi:hypothetical protein